jgi:hypothetical protein
MFCSEMARRRDTGKRPMVEPEPEPVPAQVDSDSSDEFGPFGPRAEGEASYVRPERYHRTRAFSQEGEIKEKLLRVRQHTRHLRWSDAYRPFFERARLERCYDLGHMYIDPQLITALAERWRESTHTFLMPFGEMTVTLQDVSFILGLPIYGLPLCLKTNDINWADKIEELLGVAPDETTFRRKSKILIKNKWLVQHFGQLSDEQALDPVQVVRHCRAFMLSFFGDVLFPDSTGDCVSAMYLVLLEDMENIGEWNWGGAVLAFLYRQLCERTRSGRVEFGGCVLLLQLWSYFHIPIGRGSVKPGVDIGVGGHAQRALGHHWIHCTRFADEYPTGYSPFYRDEFDRLRSKDITWQPYEVFRPLLAPMCIDEEPITFRPQPLYFFWIIEMYNPDRVMRQFGLLQTVPPPVRDTDYDEWKMHSVKHGRGDDWPTKYENFFLYEEDLLVLASQALPAYDPATEAEYLRWYHGAFYPFVQTGISHDEGSNYRSNIPNQRRLVSYLFIYLFICLFVCLLAARHLQTHRKCCSEGV